jgi:hypothetical protein
MAALMLGRGPPEDEPSRTRQASPITEISDLRKSRENERGPKNGNGETRNIARRYQSHPGQPFPLSTLRKKPNRQTLSVSWMTLHTGNRLSFSLNSQLQMWHECACQPLEERATEAGAALLRRTTRFG